MDAGDEKSPNGGGGGKGISSGKSQVIIDDPELDALLNEALQDFDKPPPTPKAKPQSALGAALGRPFPGVGMNDEMNEIWTEEFIKEATAQFEKKMRECLNPGTGAGPSCLPDNLNKVVEAATKAAVGNAAEPTGIASQINEALKTFASAPDVLADSAAFNDNDLAKLMSNFSMGDSPDDGGMDEILPFMTNVMQKLLSKDLLYPVLTDIVDRYPEWLADNRQKISKEDFDKYNSQYAYMKQICEAYASEQEADSADVKRKRFDKISELMLKVQCCGPPPKDLVGEEGIGFPSVDPSAMGLGGDQCIIS